MPIFDAKDLDTDPDGEGVLARLLYPSPQARSSARARGQRRVERGSMATEAVAPQCGSAGPTGREPAVSPAD